MKKIITGSLIMLAGVWLPFYIGSFMPKLSGAWWELPSLFTIGGIGLGMFIFGFFIFAAGMEER